MNMSSEAHFGFTYDMLIGQALKFVICLLELLGKYCQNTLYYDGLFSMVGEVIRSFDFTVTYHQARAESMLALGPPMNHQRRMTSLRTPCLHSHRYALSVCV